MKELVDFLQHGIQLKQTARTGWVMRGVNQPESVAGHSYGVALTCMMLANLIDTIEFDMGKLLQIALIHDLAEAVVTDLPTPIKKYLPMIDGVSTKEILERNAWKEMTKPLPTAEQYNKLWEEMNTAETPEAKLVKDADKLDVYLQLHTYQMQTGNARLKEFWSKIEDGSESFHYDVSRDLYIEIIRRYDGVKGW